MTAKQLHSVRWSAMLGQRVPSAEEMKARMDADWAETFLRSFKAQVFFVTGASDRRMYAPEESDAG